MNRVLGQRFAPIMAGVFAACAFHAPPTTPPPATSSGSSSGMLRANNALTLDAGVSDVRVVVEVRDSVLWSFDTRPVGCATAVVEPGRLSVGHRDNNCVTKWDVRAPIIDDVRRAELFTASGRARDARE